MKSQNKLNDPFGRVGRRQANNYTALKNRLLAEGISSLERLDATIHRVRVSAWLFAAIVIAMTLLVAVTVPAWRGLVTVFGVLGLVWIAANAFQTRMHLRRYRRELLDLSRDQSSYDREKGPNGGDHRCEH